MYKVLFVDDEPNILKSLKRIFFNEDNISVFTAENAQAGVEIIKREQIDLLITDEKMPKVQGNELVRFVKENFPDVVRIILTGYSDNEAIIKAINQGEVYRYLTKPWNDEEIIIIVKKALEYGQLKRKNKELTRLVQKQNKELAESNSELQEKVKERTVYLEKALKTVKESNLKSKKRFKEIVKILNHIITLFQRNLGEKLQRVAVHCLEICKELELSEEETNLIHTAALLYEIGYIGENTDIKDLNKLHCELGENLLRESLSLEKAASIVRHHHENFDGSGFPDGLSNKDIPIGSRIIRVANDFDEIKFGKNKGLNEAVNYLLTYDNKYYDPHIVQIVRFKEQERESSDLQGLTIKLKDIATGMVPKTDILFKNGLLCIASDTVITETIVKKMEKFKDLLNLEKEIPIKV